MPAHARASSLGPVGGAVGRALAELEPRLSACFDELAQARHGQERFTVAPDASLAEEAGPPVLLLQLEARDGEVVVVDAPVETRGSASDGLIACAQSVLRGQRLPAPEARAGQRHRLLFQLIQ